MNAVVEVLSISTKQQHQINLNSPNAKVVDLKQEIRNQFGNESDKQILISKGQILNDDYASLANISSVVLLLLPQQKPQIRSTSLTERYPDPAPPVPKTPENFETFIPTHLATKENTEMMISMGFNETRAIKALVLAGGSLEDAVEWLSQHQEDADIDTPLSFEQYKAIGGLRRKEILPPAIQVAIQNCVCTFAVTGKTFCPQVWYKCETCHLVNNEGCCASCAKFCHAGHSLIRCDFSERFFCDCGAYRPNCLLLGTVFK